MTEPLSSRILKSMIASCDCLTKTPEAEFHDECCRYRVLSDCYIVVSAAEGLTNSIVKNFLQKTNASEKSD